MNTRPHSILTARTLLIGCALAGLAVAAIGVFAWWGWFRPVSRQDLPGRYVLDCRGRGNAVGRWTLTLKSDGRCSQEHLDRGGTRSRMNGAWTYPDFTGSNDVHLEWIAVPFRDSDGSWRRWIGDAYLPVRRSFGRPAILVDVDEDWGYTKQ